MILKWIKFKLIILFFSQNFNQNFFLQKEITRTLGSTNIDTLTINGLHLTSIF